MAEILHCIPSSWSHPGVRMGRIHGERGVEVPVGFLRCGNDDKNTVDIGFKTRIGVGLESIAGSFDGLVDIRVVKWESTHGDSVGRMGRIDEVTVAA